MHNNEEYYIFLKNLPGGEDLYERVLNVENLYQYGFYENVQHSARMFFECFVDNICEAKHITPIKSSDRKQPINYKSTIRYIFEKSNIKDPIWYKNNDIDRLYEDINKSSHSKGLENVNSTVLQEDNEEILYIIRDTCIWYYNRVGKTKRNFDEYNLPDVIDVREGRTLEVNSTEAVEKNREIYESIRNRNNELLSLLKEKDEKLRFQEDDIKKLEHKNLTLQKDLNILNNDNSTLNDKISVLQAKLNNKDSNKINDKLIERLKFAQKEILEINFQKEEKNTIITNNQKEIIELKQLLKEKDDQIKYLEDLKNKITSITIEKKEPEQNIFHKIGPRTQVFINRILSVIEIMNDLGCYAKMGTILRFLKGEQSKQSYFYPQLMESELWGIYCTEVKFHYRYLEQAINTLLYNKTIYLDDEGNYKIVRV